MDFLDILKTAGSAVLSIACPAAIPVIAAVNGLLPASKQLPVDATGDQVKNAYEALPPDARVQIDEIAAKVEMARLEKQSDVYIAQCKADGQSSRAAIARQMSLTTCGVILLFAYGFLSEALGSDSITWQVFGLLIGTPSAVLLAYFGVLRKEHAQRNGVESKGLLGMAAGVLGKWKG